MATLTCTYWSWYPNVRGRSGVPSSRAANTKAARWSRGCKVQCLPELHPVTPAMRGQRGLYKYSVLRTEYCRHGIRWVRAIWIPLLAVLSTRRLSTVRYEDRWYCHLRCQRLRESKGNLARVNRPNMQYSVLWYPNIELMASEA